jgi:histidyl-tRNA synthetase
MPDQFQAPIGTKDVLPPESERWLHVIATFAGVAERAGFGLVHGPLFEELAVFQRLGEGTDVVRKEMYDFRDKGDRHLALRPEGTASVVRAYVQHRPPTPWKVWYLTPAFRYESPQAGRLRQHHQFGVEVIGPADPDVDVEVIALGHAFLAALGLSRVRLVINTMGTPADRAAYADVLRSWLRERAGDLAAEDREKIDTHPLRVLDSKRPPTIEVVASAPRIVESLDKASLGHFDRVRAGLDALGVDHEVDTTLVRGLDYYTHTVFEARSDAIDAAQSTLVAGGRYDGLVEQLGGPATPAMGFGSGLERTLLACDHEGLLVPRASDVDVFVVDVTDGSLARDLTHALRREGIRCERAYDGRSMKAQMKAADRSGARLALIVGEQEVADGTVTVRDLRGSAAQVTVRREDLIGHVRRALEEMS